MGLKSKMNRPYFRKLFIKVSVLRFLMLDRNIASITNSNLSKLQASSLILLLQPAFLNRSSVNLNPNSLAEQNHSINTFLNLYVNRLGVKLHSLARYEPFYVPEVYIIKVFLIKNKSYNFTKNMHL